MSLNPYLTFTKSTKEAMTRYHEILGGDLEVMTFDQLPSSDELAGQVPGDLVMHALLTLDDGCKLMASDDPSGDGLAVKGVSLNLTFSDADEARRVFDALADGGTVTMPLEPTFWAPLFGMCVDRFGVPWMFNFEPEEQN